MRVDESSHASVEGLEVEAATFSKLSERHAIAQPLATGEHVRVQTLDARDGRGVDGSGHPELRGV